MYALVNPDHTLNKLTSAESIEWNHRFWNNLSSISPATRKANNIYDAVPAAPVDKYHTITAASWVVNTGAGTVTETLSVADKPAADVVAMIWPDIQAKRDGLIQTAGVKVSVGGADHWFHSDTYSKLQQMALLQLGANLPAGLQWKTMSGAFVTLTQADVTNIFMAQVAKDQAIFAAAQTHKSAMEALSTVEAIMAYDWSAGWPEAYVA